MANTRTLTIEMVPHAGNITRFIAFVDGQTVIDVDGNQEARYQGEVPAAQVHMKVRVHGIHNARYKLGIDLPGTAEDQDLTLTLSGGFHEHEFRF